jgi:hypothetical protein
MATLITRRNTTLSIAAFAGLATLRPRLAQANSQGVRVGASRWDAWYTSDSLKSTYNDSWHARDNLDPNRYHFRAPWFAVQKSRNLMNIDGNQANMDAELVYAAAGGLKFWEFLKYEPGRDGDFSNAWNLFQASAYRTKMNWCWRYGYTQLLADQSANNFATLISQLRQSNYETVEGRPMIYMSRWATSRLGPLVAAFRSACKAAGLANPYIVYEGSAADMKIMSLDALGDYACPLPKTTYGPYASMVSAVERYWTTRSAQGVPIIPTCMTGWDRRPRVEHPVPWETWQRPFEGMSNSYTTATPLAIASHLRDCLDWIGKHPGLCPSRKAVIYSWNEFDEGGWLCPTWTSSGPDDSRLTVLASTIS